ncbi:SurA N-terminal domain-containing protein [Chelatococcus sp. GCM10030263]|uniref:peptidylprolyl isomerase n=1 Tax=Chelatococcus sp. GCM10030263 TaxID=3273387 RepID=UPI00362203D1
MLNRFRNAGKSWLGRIAVAVMFGFLIISFGLWGIGDIFRGYGANTAAKVGSVEISTQDLRNAYQADLARLIRQVRQPISAEQARQLGLENQVLSRLIGEAALDQRATELGIGISDQDIARTVMDDPMFRNAAGQFDRAAFDEILRTNGLNEATYLRDQRAVIIRRQLAESVVGAMTAPLTMREAIYRYGAERRNVSYLVMPASSAGQIADPDEAALQTWFDARKAVFRAPEFRGVATLVVTPNTLAKPDDVSDDEARKLYESAKATRFGTPERRTVQQIAFPNDADAQAAADKIKAGTSFDAIASERGIAPNDLTLGTFAKSELVDPAIADAAFGLAQGAVSAPVKGRFATVLLRVTAIEPAQVKPFEEVATEIKQEIARSKAQAALTDIHDKIEDQRLSAKPLADIATELGLQTRTIPAMDRSGQDKGGKAIAGLQGGTALINAVFASDVGADNEPVSLPEGGYVWYDVTGVEPAHDRPLAEVRDDVLARWRADAIAKALSDKARALSERLDKGEPIATIATELSVPVKTAEGLARNTPKDDLTGPVVAQIFAVPSGKAGSAASDPEGGSRVLFQVTAATVPPFITSTAQAGQLDEQLRTALSDDILSEYVADLQNTIGVTVNQQAVRTTFGAPDF